MKPARRVRLALVGLLAASAVLKAAPTILDVPVFEGGYGIGFYVDTARRFEALRPEVRVHVYGNPRIQDQLRVRIIDGRLPDAASVPYILWSTLVNEGKLVDLRPALGGPDWEGDARWSDTFLPGSLDSWRIKGGVYGLPFVYSCWFIFYNRGMFREHGWTEPRTWDEFFDLCTRMRTAGFIPLSLPGTRWLYPDAFFRAAYHNLAGPKGWEDLARLDPGAWSDPRVVQAAGILGRLTREDLQPGWEGDTAQNAELLFLQGRAAMTATGSWFFNEMAGRIPADMEIGTMSFPVSPDGVADPTTIESGSDCFFVFHTGNPERERQTLDFLRFLTSRARAEAFVRETDAPAAIRGIPVSAFSPRMRPTAEKIARARESFGMVQVMMMPPVLRQVRVDATRELMTGRLTPEAFARRLEAAAADDRARRAEPDRVDYRHPVAGTALVAALVLVPLLLLRRPLVRWLGAASGAASRGADPSAFARLRGSMAAGFVGPAFLLYGVFMLAPAAVSFAWAFTGWDGIGPRRWVGLYNFKSLLFESDVLWTALGNNLFLVVVPALCVVPLSLFLALLLHRGVRGARTFRAILLFPNLLGGIAATLIWLTAYQPHGGLVNAVLVDLGRALRWEWLRSFADYPWLAEQHLYAALIPIYIWLACGFNVVLYLAAMEGIDPQLYEAAEIDGAPVGVQFFTITLPLIREIIAISVAFLVIGGLNAFEMIWLLTSQDPSASSQTLATLLVTTMFKDFDIGRAAALAVILFCLVLAAGAAVLAGLKGEPVDA